LSSSGRYTTVTWGVKLAPVGLVRGAERKKSWVNTTRTDESLEELCPSRCRSVQCQLSRVYSVTKSALLWNHRRELVTTKKFSKPSPKKKKETDVVNRRGSPRLHAKTWLWGAKTLIIGHKGFPVEISAGRLESRPGQKKMHRPSE